MSPGSPIEKVAQIYPIRGNLPDDLFITCASFEERFLGAPTRIRGKFPKQFVLFRFSHPNQRRESLIKNMERTLSLSMHKQGYYQIEVRHGKSVEGVLELHSFLTEKELNTEALHVTVDISTFTKDLLFNLMLYLVSHLNIKKLRLLYTIPEGYASPDEGWLSYGIESVHIPPMGWNAWSPLKYNLLIIILGFEEMRAWSLIDKFSSDLNWLFVTSPGSKPAWNNYCQQYNKRLLREIHAKGTLPALNPAQVFQVLSAHVTREISEKYNIFIAPLGTKAQLVGTLPFSIPGSDISMNVITTSVVDHNVPYYSWGVGDSFEFFLHTEVANHGSGLDGLLPKRDVGHP